MAPSLVDARGEGLPSEGDHEGTREQSFSTTSDPSGQFSAMGAHCVAPTLAAPDTGATAKLICFKWSGHHSSISKKREIARAQPYPAHARFKFGDGRLGVVRHAVDIPAGNCWRSWETRGLFTGGGYPNVIA